MINIKSIKIALMQLNEINEVKDIDDTIKSFGDFNSKFAATLNIQEILSSQIGNINEDNFDDVIPQILSLVYDDLFNLTKEDNIDVDSIGIWINYNDDRIVENSIKLSVLDDIKRYGADDINPIYEFYNMTIQKDEEIKTI